MEVNMNIMLIKRAFKELDLEIFSGVDVFVFLLREVEYPTFSALVITEWICFLDLVEFGFKYLILFTFNWDKVVS